MSHLLWEHWSQSYGDSLLWVWGRYFFQLTFSLNKNKIAFLLKKYEFLAILGFWNISNTHKPPFGINLNTLPIKRSDLRHPKSTYVVTPGGQTCTFWRKMTRFWQFSRVFRLLYTFTHEIPPKTYVFLKIWSKLL